MATRATLGARVALSWSMSCGMLAVALPAAAIDLEKLVMPGDVIEGHAEVEGECGRCHARFQTEAQDELCGECHDEVASDLAAGSGFHGHAPGVREAACRDCHSEHRGREADIVGLDRAGFEHDFTDYPLRGAHRRVACEHCHDGARPFREAESQCVACHRDDDAHAGELGDDCADCHSENGWAEARFDHDSTRFPLEGEHRNVDCALCHPGNRFENTVSDCQGCHRLNDEHMGRFGTRCEKCHTPEGWKRLAFDHDRDTRFPLSGRHDEAKCEACHKGVLYREALATDCISCHRADDVHRGRNGDSCDDCHSAKGWESDRFDHGRMTDFPLRGAHADVKCERCHTKPLAEQELSARCYDCHRDDDVHAGQQGSRCETCHNEEGWSVKVFFEHDLTRFPLLGLHAVAACEQCHLSPRFQDARTKCVSCHIDEDVHLSRLGPRCGLCHNPNGWKVWLFDHDRQTAFALRGAHENLDCHACHAAPVEAEIQLAQSCHGCHAKDDPHHAAYGYDCGRCHEEDSWRNVHSRQ